MPSNNNEDAASYGSRVDLRRRSTAASSNRSQPNGAALYQPGRQPIGFLAARGTPYEKKYLTKKLGACCLFIAPVVLLVTLAIVLTIVLYAIGEHALHTSQIHIHQANITGISNTSFPLVLDGQVSLFHWTMENFHSIFQGEEGACVADLISVATFSLRQVAT